MIKPESGLMEMIRDPDEGSFLRSLLGMPGDHPPRNRLLHLIGRLRVLLGRPPGDELLLSYAAVLKKRDRARSEFLRLEVLLSGRGSEDRFSPEQQSFHRELLHRLTPFELWLRLVRRNYRILNCGGHPGAALSIRFRFECPATWESLAATPDKDVRFCAGCHRDVFYCDDILSAEEHALAGHCITIPARLAATIRNDLTPDMTGMPDPDIGKHWAKKLFGDDMLSDGPYPE